MDQNKIDDVAATWDNVIDLALELRYCITKIKGLCEADKLHIESFTDDESQVLLVQIHSLATAMLADLDSPKLNGKPFIELLLDVFDNLDELGALDFADSVSGVGKYLDSDTVDVTFNELTKGMNL